MSAIMTRARRVVGEATQFYLKADNRLFSVDLCSRFVYFTDGVNDFNKIIRAFEGRLTTVVIAKGYPNACTIATLLARYASAVKEAPPTSTMRYHADLAAAMLYSVATFT